MNFRHKIQQKKQNQVGRWSKLEHQKFMLGLITYGKDWKKIERLISTRNGSQVRSHAQKFFSKLLKNKIKINKQKRKTAKDMNHFQFALQTNIIDISYNKENFKILWIQQTQVHKKHIHQIINKKSEKFLLLYRKVLSAINNNFKLEKIGQNSKLNHKAQNSQNTNKK